MILKEDGEQERLLLRVPEAAAKLGVARSTLYNLLASGDLPRVKLGGSVRIPASALEIWIARNTVTRQSNVGFITA